MAGKRKDVCLFPDGIHIFYRSAEEDLLPLPVRLDFGSHRRDIWLIIGVSPELHLPVRKSLAIRRRFHPFFLYQEATTTVTYFSNFFLHAAIPYPNTPK